MDLPEPINARWFCSSQDYGHRHMLALQWRQYRNAVCYIGRDRGEDPFIKGVLLHLFWRRLGAA